MDEIVEEDPMKKVTSWLLLLSLVTLLLPAFAVAEGTVTLEWFMDYAALPSKWNLEEPVFAGITQATGVQCSFNMPAEDASTKLNLLMISRNLPDIITNSDGDLRSELIAAGLGRYPHQRFGSQLLSQCQLYVHPDPQEDGKNLYRYYCRKADRLRQKTAAQHR
mgnify:CR=1 FL=1